MELKEIAVNELKLGMYVSKLDRPWTETPFIFQGFILRDQKQIDTIKQFCKLVYVDPEQEDLSDTRALASGSAASIRGTTVYQDSVTLDAELPLARSAIAKTTSVLSQISRDVQVGGAVDGAKVRQAASDITESVVRNPDAATLLVQMQQKSGESFSRAMHVSVTMSIFGRFLQLPRESIELLGLLGLLQDAGKLKLPSALLEKREPLTTEEAALYQTHVDHSVEILTKTAGLPNELPGLASLHHEHFDGSGYPRGLRGVAIALPGMIAAIVDAFDTLVAPPPQGKHMSPSNALNVIYKGRGSLFQPALVEQFIQCVGVYPVGSAVELNTGEIGIVIAQNPLRRLQPRVMVVKDAKGYEKRPYTMLDLAKEPKATPDEIYRIRRTLEYDAIKVDPKELFL
ncbi:MAG TPA: HD domain-containing phosphohydrolase [Burkholderiales bacterium]|nr:HD domain-containing phosphohydrolase [Burkholderiales bacterium]